MPVSHERLHEEIGKNIDLPVTKIEKNLHDNEKVVPTLLSTKASGKASEKR